LASNKVEVISSGEVLSRFLFNGNQFSLNGVKQAAFLPAKNHETSIFRKTKLVQFSLYESIKELIASERGMQIKGVALIEAEKIQLADLKVEIEESKHQWHANIIGWPLEKHQQKQLALILAQNSSLE